MRARAHRAAALISAVHGEAYSAVAYEPPLFSGSFVDWAYGAVQIDAYLIELRPDAAAHPAQHPWLSQHSAFEPPAAEVEPTWEENRPAVLFLLQAYGALGPS